MKLNSIQFLRATAAILVVHTHSIDLQMYYSTSRHQNFYYIESFGAIGVDIFFVISGFIITFVTNKYQGRDAAITFLKKRFLRINPVYYIACLLYLLFVSFRLWGHQSVPSVQSAGILNMFLIIPVFHDYTLPTLIVGWTLSFEWLFYIIFSLLILLKINNKTLFLIIILSGLVIIGAILKSNDYRIRYITSPLCIEFLFGVIIYWIYANFKIVSLVAFILLLMGVAGFIYLIFNGYGDVSQVMAVLTGNSGIKRLLLWGIPSGFLVAGCIFLEQNGIFTRFWNNKLIILIGDASYSIYLTHGLVLFTLNMLYSITGFFLNADLSVFVQIILAIMVGIFFYLNVEKPLLSILLKKN